MANGKVVQVIGPVVDIEFPAGELPAVLSVVELDFPAVGPVVPVAVLARAEQQVDLAVLKELQAKADVFYARRNKTWYALFSKSGFTSALREEAEDGNDKH